MRDSQPEDFGRAGWQAHQLEIAPLPQIPQLLESARMAEGPMLPPSAGTQSTPALVRRCRWPEADPGWALPAGGIPPGGKARRGRGGSRHWQSACGAARYNGRTLEEPWPWRNNSE